MKTSRPSGISQENRSHPYFILLRHFTDEQRELIVDISKTLVRATVTRGILVIPLVAMLFISAQPIAIAVTFLYTLNLIYSIASIFQRYESLVAETIITQVDHIIYSDEYQYQSLSNEQLINMMNGCKETNGKAKMLLDTIIRDRNRSFFEAAMYLAAGIIELLM